MSSVTSASPVHSSDENIKKSQHDRPTSQAVSLAAKSDDSEIPRSSPSNGKPDAPTLIHAVLEMHFSDKVNMATFSNKGAWGSSQSHDENDTKEPVLCEVYLKHFPVVPLEIWYNAEDSLVLGGRAVFCAGRQHRYTNVRELKAVIALGISQAKKLFRKGRRCHSL
jgi:hypothetical protein